VRDALAEHRLARGLVVEVYRVGVEGDRGKQQDVGVGDGFAEAGGLADPQVLEVGGHGWWRPGVMRAVRQVFWAQLAGKSTAGSRECRLA
jgi:hypothetical protein